MQRIYGTVWETQEELDQYLWRREEAKKRDHRRLGVQLDLFSFHDVAPGSAFWHPKGWRLYQTLRGAMRELQERRGYEEIYTPPLVHQKLWEQSGHWALYRDNMYLVDVEGQWFSLKPMNCPESSFVYRSRLRSYRDLPLRLSEYGVLHRNELSGVLSGLTRVRHFVTDDAHIYVRPDQIASEIEALMGEIREAYGWFGLTPTLTFGTRPDKALGDPAVWAETEAIMRAELDRSGLQYRVKEKDGAFYAPKLDIQITDALGREWQTATIQVDRVMLPEQFDLHYIDEHGQQQRPVAIHRAIYGSLERFIGVLTEHFAGAFPLWCAPVQAVVIPIADRHVDAAGELAAELRAAGVRFVEVDDSDNRMQNKIRLAQGQKVPYMLILGDREVEARTASVRRRDGSQEQGVALGRPGVAPGRGGPGEAGVLRRPERQAPSGGGGIITAMGRDAERVGRDRCQRSDDPRNGRRLLRSGPTVFEPSASPPRRCRPSNPCAILPRRPRRSWDCARRDLPLETKGRRHQPRPAREPDDPCPTGAGRR